MNADKLLNTEQFLIHKNPKKIIFMLHGYGDNAKNFVQIAKLLNQKNWLINYISINAPVSLKEYPSGYQWFDIYPNGKYIQDATYQDLKIVESDIKSSLLSLKYTIYYYLNNYKLQLIDSFVIGFSQGGMIAFELGNYLKNRLGAIGIISSKIISKNKIINNNLKNTPIFISHGDKDNVLSINDFYKSLDFLKNNNCFFESYKILNDDHTISENTIKLLQKFIKKNL